MAPELLVPVTSFPFVEAMTWIFTSTHGLKSSLRLLLSAVGYLFVANNRVYPAIPDCTIVSSPLSTYILCMFSIL